MRAIIWSLTTAGLLLLFSSSPFAQEIENQSGGLALDSSQTILSESASHIIDYQGYLSSSHGEPITGPLTIRFSIWDAQEGGQNMWNEQLTVDVRTGYFTAQLGSSSPLPPQLFAGDARWLQLEIGNEILKPRKRINAVAHALQANNAASLGGLPAEAYYPKSEADDHTKNDIDAARLGGSDAAAFLTSSQSDGRYVRKGFPNTITSEMIVDGTIQPQDLGFTAGSGNAGVSRILTQNGLEGGGTGEVRIGLNPSYQTGQAYDNRFVKVGSLNSVTSVMIADDAVSSADIKDGAIEQVDLGFPAGTINGVNAGEGLTGGGTMGSVTLSLRDDYRSGAAYDAHFVVRNEANSISSSMIRDNEISSVDIKDGSLQQQDMAFPAGDITGVQATNGLDGGGQSGNVIIGLESAYMSGVAYDSRFVKRNEASSITSQMIQNYTIQQEDMAFTAGDITAVTTTGGLVGGGVSGDVQLKLDVPYQTGEAYTDVFVEENQSSSVTGDMIVDGDIRGADIAQNVIRGEHLAQDFYVKQDIANGAVISAENESINLGSSGLEGRGSTGVRGIGSSTGVYGEGSDYGVYAKSTVSANYALYVEGKAFCTRGDWGDLAEYIASPEPLEPGDVVIIDPLSENQIVKCNRAEDTRVAGIVSTAPTITVGRTPKEGHFALALAGIVPCKVVANEPISPGDLLTTSERPGYAQKAVNPKIGTIVGKALEGLQSGSGTIRVLVTLQ